MRRQRTRIEATELTQVETPLLRQLEALDWETVVADEEGNSPTQTGRTSFKEYILSDIFRHHIIRINDQEHYQSFVDGNYDGWIGDEQFNQISNAILRIPSGDIMEANLMATDLLHDGINIRGDGIIIRGHETIQLIDFDNLENNHFQAVSQLKVAPEWWDGVRGHIFPDIVLFVNGIPLVVIECKGRGIQQPMFEGIKQLRRYQNIRGSQRPEGAPQMFTFVQLVVSTHMTDSKYASVGSDAPYFQRCEDSYPYSEEEVMSMVETTRGRLFRQERLVAGMFNHASLLGIIQNSILYEEGEGDTIKIVPRYPQKRAIEKTIARLKGDDGSDSRGGVVWHTQGSGKSMTMGCIAKAIMNDSELHDYKIVFMTDRTNLETQLKDSPAFASRRVRVATSITNLQSILSEDGPDLVFGMIQKINSRLETEDADEVRYTADPDAPESTVLMEKEDGRTRKILVLKEETLTRLNNSERIVVIADEAHRTHTGTLHRALKTALPNAAFIGFTGTPIMDESRITTQEIFGEEIDRYTIDQAEADGVILPIRYEGREIELIVDEDIDENLNNQLREEIIRVIVQQGRAPTPESARQTMSEEIEVMVQETIARNFSRNIILALPSVIRRKARDIVDHYVLNIMVDGFKAQVVAVSRHAAVCYQTEITEALSELIEELENAPQTLHNLSDEEINGLEERERFIARVIGHLDTIRTLEATAVISKRQNDDADVNAWADSSLHKEHIRRFKQPLETDGMSFLCVNRMLTTGFSASVEKVMYLDKRMEGHELLQTIARVNRLSPNKEFGLVVDYNAIHERFLEAREIYTSEGLEVEFSNIIEDCLENLAELERQMYAFFEHRGVEAIEDLDDVDRCVLLLVPADEMKDNEDDESSSIREEFRSMLSQFLRFFSRIAYRTEASHYHHSSKLFSLIYKDACNMANEENLIVSTLPNMVKEIVRNSVMGGEINLRVAPISLSDDDFEEYIKSLRSHRAKAQTMHFAIQHHITLHMDDASVLFTGLQDRLDDAVDSYHDDWERLVEFLEAIKGDAIAGITSSEVEGLEPLQVPVLHILVGEEAHSPDDIVIVESCWEIMQNYLLVVNHLDPEETMESMRRELWRLLRLRGMSPDDAWDAAAKMSDYSQVIN